MSRHILDNIQDNMLIRHVITIDKIKKKNYLDKLFR